MKMLITTDHRPAAEPYHYVNLEFDTQEKRNAVLEVLRLAGANIQYENNNKNTNRVCFKPDSAEIRPWKSTL